MFDEFSDDQEQYDSYDTERGRYDDSDLGVDTEAEGDS